MIGLALSSFGRRMLSNEASLRASLTCPVLVWEAPPAEGGKTPLFATGSTSKLNRPSATEPVVFELKKMNARSNAFSMGITVGRTDNNDITIADDSISRFHAYFTCERLTDTWKLIDAESKNGTWLGPLRLPSNSPHPLPPIGTIKFGGVQLRFFLPSYFLEYLHSTMHAAQKA